MLIYLTVEYDYRGRSYLNTNMDTNQWFCWSRLVVNYSSQFMSAWITIAITIERFIAVRFPLQVYADIYIYIYMTYMTYMMCIHKYNVYIQLGASERYFVWGGLFIYILYSISYYVLLI